VKTAPYGLDEATPLRRIIQAAATAAGKERLKLLRRYPMIGVLTIANTKRIKKIADTARENDGAKVLDIAKIGANIAKSSSGLKSLGVALIETERALFEKNT
jgi:hypothetical protein